MNKNIKLVCLVLIILGAISCKKDTENYEEYLTSSAWRLEDMTVDLGININIMDITRENGFEPVVYLIFYEDMTYKIIDVLDMLSSFGIKTTEGTWSIDDDVLLMQNTIDSVYVEITDLSYDDLKGYTITDSDSLDMSSFGDYDLGIIEELIGDEIQVQMDFRPDDYSY